MQNKAVNSAMPLSQRPVDAPAANPSSDHPQTTVGAPLTADLVRSRLRGQSPSDVQTHWVDVEGVRWPVTQALSVASGEPKIRSNQSRRILKRLGFKTGSIKADQEYPATAFSSETSPISPLFDGAMLVPVDSAHISLRYTWQRAGAVVLDGNGFPLFPSLPPDPGLYRFDFGFLDGHQVVYIGEGKSIANRALQYRKAKFDRERPLTSRRLHRAMVDHIVSGQTIEMSIVLVAHFADGSCVNFYQKSGRLMVESTAVVLAQLDPTIRVLNVDQDLRDSPSS